MRSIFLALLLSSSLNACAGPAGDIPRFYEVDPGRIDRLAQPTELGIAELAKKGVRTIIKLNTDNLDMERAAASHAGIRLIEKPISGLFAPNEQTENEIQALLRDPHLWPIAFHCEQGRDRTGLVAALYRMNVQGWSPDAAHKEWMDLGHSVFLKGMDDYFWSHVKK